VRLEQLGEGLAFASGSLGAAPESSVVAYGTEDAVHALIGEPYSGF
jgi:hypothetical protein